jgi:phosphoribosyl-ATP pyrophosphohydrolase
MTETVLPRLAAIIAARRTEASGKSYTKELLDGGPEKCAKKLGEEAVETVIAALGSDTTALKREAADLLYHLLVLLEVRRVPLADFDRRQARRIATGKLEIEARIDLHGMRQSDAAARLRAFLFDAHARGLKTVLVITGKGGEAPRGDYMAESFGEKVRGVLRRSVPGWLDGPELRTVVLGYTTAGVRHGGEGALYVQLRRPARRGDGHG